MSNATVDLSIRLSADCREPPVNYQFGMTWGE